MAAINLSRKEKTSVFNALQLLAGQEALRIQRKKDTISRLKQECEELEKEMKTFIALAERFYDPPLPEGVAEVERP